MPSGPASRSQSENALAADPLLGTVLNDKYHVLAVVGSGGMGKIYRAEQIPLGRPVALKVLHPAHTSTAKEGNFQQRFFLEASILSRLQHPNVVTVFDYGYIEGTHPEMYFMAMEYLAGETLEHRIRRQGFLSPEELLPIVRQISRGLQDAHRQGVVHRDLKPSNVMLVARSDGSMLVKIVDFGLVKVLGTDSDQITREGTFLGSARYMSPEQIVHGGVDHRTDVYALGVLMFEALCGVPPFQREDLIQTLMAHVHEPIPEMASVAPNVHVPLAVEAMVRRCMSKEPSERPPDMDSVLAEIDVCARALGFPVAPSDRYDVESGELMRGDHVVTRSDALTRAEGRSPSLSITKSENAPLVFSPENPDTKTLARAKSSRKLLIVIALLLLPISAGALFVLFRHTSTTEVSHSSDQPGAAEPSTPSHAFVLWIDSTPSGAEVLEGDTVLGTTPMQLSIDNDTVRDLPKRLTLRAPGHRPYSLVQGPSKDNVRVAVALQPVPAEDSDSAPKPLPRKPSGPSTPPHSPPTADPGIRLHR